MLNSKELVQLEGGRFTSRDMLQVERALVSDGVLLDARRGHEVKQRYLDQAVARRGNLSAEQRGMVEHVVRNSGDLAVVQGAAGAGKSYALGTAREAWEAQGYRVRGAALAGKAAEGLQVSAGIEARSLHAWEWAWSQGREQLTKRDVLVIDEAGMVGSRQLGRVLAEAERAGAKVVLVGDARQLQAIEAGAPMRLLGERHGQAKLDEVRRQNDGWQRQASKDLAEGKVGKALDAYEKAGAIHGHDEQRQARDALVAAWNSDRQGRGRKGEAIMLAYRRVDVAELNQAARQLRRDAGELGRDHKIRTEQGTQTFARGDRLYFLKNDRSLGVLNGSLGTVESIRGSVMQVRLDDGRQVAFDTKEYGHIGLGYAATVHKAQGVTVDRAYVLTSRHYDQHVAYVAMTRHRDQVQVYWSREEMGPPGELLRKMSRARPKEVALDYRQQEREVQALARKVEGRRKADPPARYPIHTREDVEKARAEEGRDVQRGSSLTEAEQIARDEQLASRKFVGEGPQVIRREEVEAVQRVLARRHAAEQAEQAKGKPAAPLRYEGMSAANLVREAMRLEMVAGQGKMVALDAFKALPEIRAAVEKRDDAHRRFSRARRELEQWERKHPMQAKLGVGQGAQLREREEKARGYYEKVAAWAEELGRRPALHAKAHAIADEHNRAIDAAKEELRVIHPYREKAREERELQRNRERESGLER